MVRSIRNRQERPNRWHRRPRPRLAVAALLCLPVALGLISCHVQQGPSPQSPSTKAPSAAADRDGPLVRVRIRSVPQLNLSAAGGLVVRPAGASEPRKTIPAPASVRRHGGGFEFRAPDGTRTQWRLASLSVEAAVGQSVMVDGQPYAGQLWLHAVDHDGRRSIDAVNHLRVEQYLPGVLAEELYGHWQPATFRAQAIAARSYVVAHLKPERRHFDVESTTASQVYGGQTTNPKATDAVRVTAGMVLTYGGTVVPAYYSSCCGGTGQDAAVAFASGTDMAPLRGRHRGAWCAASRFYRWGPIRRPKAGLARRFAAWGRAHRHPIGSLSGLGRITIATQNQAGRAARFTIVDQRRQTFALGAESFRNAANHEAHGVPELAKDQRLPSSHVRVVVGPAHVVFANGQGHGHGVGMCQHGSEALARANYGAGSILDFYYKGARVERIY